MLPTMNSHIETLETRRLFAALAFKTVSPLSDGDTTGTTVDQSIIQPDGQVDQAFEASSGIFISRYDASGNLIASSLPIGGAGATLNLNSIYRASDGKLAISYRTLKQFTSTTPDDTTLGQVQVLNADLTLLGDSVPIPSADVTEFAISPAGLYFSQSTTTSSDTSAATTTSLIVTKYGLTSAGASATGTPITVASKTVPGSKSELMAYAIGGYDLQTDSAGGFTVGWSEATTTLAKVSKVVGSGSSKQTVESDPYVTKTAGGVFVRHYNGAGTATGPAVKLATGLGRFNTVALAENGAGTQVALVAGGPTTQDSIPKYLASSQTFTAPVTTTTQSDVILATATVSASGKVKAGLVTTLYSKAIKAKGTSVAFSTDFLDAAMSDKGTATAFYGLHTYTQASDGTFEQTDADPTLSVAQVVAGKQPFSAITLKSNKVSEIGTVAIKSNGDVGVIFNPADGFSTSIGAITTPKQGLGLVAATASVQSLGKPGKASSVKVVLKNAGTLGSTGTAVVKLTLQTQGQPDRVITPTLTVPAALAAGKKSTMILNFKVPAGAVGGLATLLVQLDPGNKLVDVDSTDNLLAVSVRVG